MNTVGRPEIQQFAGALQGQRARKGAFITTSGFSNQARNYARNIETRIVLIDGDELARLMIAHGVGVTPLAVFEVKRVDWNYFSEEWSSDFPKPQLVPVHLDPAAQLASPARCRIPFVGSSLMRASDRENRVPAVRAA